MRTPDQLCLGARYTICVCLCVHWFISQHLMTGEELNIGNFDVGILVLET